MSSHFCLIAAYLTLAALPAPARPVPTYTVTDMGTMPTYTVTDAMALNQRGEAAGYCFTSPTRGPQAFLWQWGRMTDLGDLGGGFSLGNGVNDAGQVTGYSWTVHESPERYGPIYHAFLWSDGIMRDLGTLPGFNDSISLSVNDRSWVVGMAEMHRDSNVPHRAFLWHAGRMTALPSLPGRPDSEACAINVRGQACGDVGREDGLQSAVLWSGGWVMNLGSLGGYSSSTARSLNDRGQILCEALPVDALHARRGARALSPRRDFIFFHGHIHTFSPPPGLTSVWPSRINNLGDAVGRAGDSDDYWNSTRSVAILWAGGTTVELNSRIDAASGWELTAAAAINDRGQILANGFHQGQYRTCLLTPIATQ